VGVSVSVGVGGIGVGVLVGVRVKVAVGGRGVTVAVGGIVVGIAVGGVVAVSPGAALWQAARKSKNSTRLARRSRGCLFIFPPRIETNDIEI
jgi:hypothetical protein